MKRIKSLILMFVALFGIVLSANATFIIQEFRITNSNQNNNLIVDPSKATSFRANYHLQASTDGMFNTVTVDVVYISNDQSETISLGTAKVYTNNTGVNEYQDYMDVSLPANKTKGRISLRMKATYPQNITILSPKSYGIETGAPVDPVLQLLIAWRKYIEPRGQISYVPAPFNYFSNTSLTAVYLTIAADGKSYDLYPDPSGGTHTELANKKLPNGHYGLRQEFYAFTRQEAVDGLVPVLRYVKKTDRLDRLFSIYPQDETIWEKVDTAFYAHNGRIPRDGTPHGDVMKHVFPAGSNMTHSFFSAYFPDPYNTQWVVPVIPPRTTISVYYADFWAFPAYKVD
jgi:hypothetical protein